jgi:phosphatidylserine/phosphatidylglycerophosphate/cardiolipin synthase-like enzyme
VLTGAVACAALAATAALLLGALPGGVDEAAAKPAKRLILAPKPGARLPARPLTVRVRTGGRPKLFRAWLNGRPIGKDFLPPRRGVRELRVAPSHGLRHGHNRLSVRVRSARGATRSGTTRFRVRRHRALAAAGRNRLVKVGKRVRLNGSRSRSHLARGAARAATGKGAPLAYRWKVVDAPKAARPRAVLKRARSARPVFRAKTPGVHRIRLTVEAPDGTTSSDIVVVKPVSVAPHIDAVAALLRERNPGTEGKVWGISTGNSLPNDWLLQTPKCWGMSNCGPGPLPPSAKPITSRMTEIVSGAERSVEISGLWPPPDGPFREAIVKGLQQAVAAGRTPTVRVILGTPPLQFSDSDFKTWFDGLVADVGGNLPIQAAAMSTYRQFIPSVATSWNHSKVLAVDGRSVMVGGMNYWANDYMQVTDPVNDVSISADGPAAADAVRFENVLWGWICANRGSSLYVSIRQSNVSGCISEAQTLPASGAGDVPILTMGRLGNGIDVPGEAAGSKSPAIPKAAVQGSACTLLQRQVSDTNTNPEYEYRNPGENGLRALIGSAESSIFISQQDLLGCVKDVEAYFDERVFAALGEKVVDGVPITIVIADEGAKAGGGDYSNGWKLKDVATVLRKVVAAKPNVSKSNARKLVCTGVGLAGVRTLDAATWPNGSPFANHAKLVWVDDAAFYVGSENLYPARLQELGMLVEDSAAAATMKSDYLDPLWDRSHEGALIDPGRKVCGSF